MRAVEWTVVRNATLIGLAIIVPVSIVASAVVDDSSRRLTWLYLLVVLLGFGAAGMAAGRTGGSTPMLHGALAAGTTFVVAATIGVIRRVAADEPVAGAAIVVAGLVALCCGVGGALGSDWLRRRSQHRRAPATAPE